MGGTTLETPENSDSQRWTLPKVTVMVVAAAIMLATIAITDDVDILCYVMIAELAVIYPLRKLVW